VGAASAFLPARGRSCWTGAVAECESSLSISSVVLYELFFGAAKSARPVENRDAAEAFAARVDVLDFDPDAAAHAGERADLERQGRSIGSYDLLIAGHARCRGLVVVTGNLDEFQRVDGLRCEDWELLH
jgi:tRNA(fMet)-specific endonuclease VapC